MIGIFDSGVGGLSVWRELVDLMPGEDYLYFADSKYAPYGLKSPDFIRERAVEISKFLIDRGAEVVVVACNTASAAALSFLRSKFDLPFVGMEPAIKPAIHKTESGVVGVLATANTFKGDLYNNTLERFAAGTKIIERVGEGLVELIESGEFEGERIEGMLRSYLLPMIDQGADSIVLGCTHYPFLEKAIKNVVGDNIAIINPAPAVALQTQRLVIQKRRNKEGTSAFYSSGNIKILTDLADMIKKK